MGTPPRRRQTGHKSSQDYQTHLKLNLQVGQSSFGRENKVEEEEEVLLKVRAVKIHHSFQL